MASGGYQPSKQGRPEPQRQTNWQRSFSSDRDDAHSLHSLPGDMRINKWDLADLHPSNLGMNSKRHKKSKGNPEREREQSLSMDSPPSEKKHHMPSSYPRTKMTANTPTSQRVALENIRLHMTFSDDEDDQANIDGERNNERQVRRKQWSFSNGSLNRTNSDDSIRATSLGLLNRNNNMHRSSKEQGPDRNQIVARLTQIRDFMKQASSMLDSLEKLGSKKRTEDVEKVRRLIRNLQEQEHGYEGLLLNSMKTPHDEADDDEEGETAGDEDEDDDDKAIEAMECSDDNISDDLGVTAKVSEASPDSRPRRESQLGIDSDGNGKGEATLDEMFLLAAGRESADDLNHSGLAESDQTTALHSGLPVQESMEGLRAATFLVGEGMSDAARQDLLQILKEKEQQLQALMSRQEELNILRLETTKKLEETKARDNIASTSLAALLANRQFVNSRPQPMQELEMILRGAGVGVNEDEERSRGAAGQDRQLKSNIVGFSESDDEDNSKVLGVEALPSKLLELKQQLTYLKNEFSQISEDPNNIETDTHGLADGGQQLQNKLCELQNKKLQLDMRLQELQLIHSPPSASSRNNEGNLPASNIHHIGQAVPQIPATLQQQQQQEASEQPQLSSDSLILSQPTNLQAQGNALASFADVAGWPEFGQSPGAQMVPGTLQGLQEKLRSLKEVREQLDHLKSAVKFSHMQTELEAAANGDGRQQTLGSVHGEHASLGTPANTVAGSNSSSSQLAQSLKPHPQQRLKQRSQQQQPQRKQPQSTQIQHQLQPQSMQIRQQKQPQSMQIQYQLQPQSVQIPQQKQPQSTQIQHQLQPQSVQIPQQKQPQSMQIPQQPQSMQIPQQLQPQSMQISQRKQSQSMQIPQRKQSQSMQIPQQPQSMQIPQRKQPHSMQIPQQPQSMQIPQQPQSMQIPQQKQPQSQQIQHQSQQKQQQTLKPTGHRYPQQLVRDRPDGTTAATAWSRNMTQLLNLEVTDPGDEHSDEDNVSASKSESVWSVFESWDNGPEMHEKLKSAKENLRQLQDLVALVQQSPDAAGGVSEEPAGRAASADGQVVLHATQTVDLNVSFSEGELPSESLRIPQRDAGGGETEDSVTELENLRSERSLLFEIQNQLQRIHSQRSGADAGEVRDKSRQNSVREKSGLTQASSTPVVTFASNDELYSKIRRQRILHEELRSKKKELEAIMKKDRNRKQYSRNQDNQSDSVSLATDTFGAAASVDATMATWGGSTADNLENITEDEDGREGDSSGRREEDNEDEDVDSTSRNRSSSSNVQRRPNLISREKNQRQSLKRQQDDDDVLTGPNADWYRGIESRLSGLTTSVEALLKRSNMEGRQPHGPPSHESAPHTSTGPTRQDQQQLLQLQNQSLMLSFGQLVQTLTRQQGDIQHLQQQVQSLQLQIQAFSFEHMPPAVAVSLPSPFRQPQPSPVVSTCSSRHRAASMAVRPIIINHQQKPNLQSQINVNHTNLPGSHSVANSGFPSVQSGSLTVTARHLPQGADKTPADGACSNLQLSQPKSLTYQGSALGKSGKQVKKTYSDSTSGARIPAARSENLGEDRSHVYRGQKGDGRGGSRAPAVGAAWARMNKFEQDESDYCSSQSVSSQCSGLPRGQAPARPADSGAAATDSTALFDTMRDTIYTEVASLISQNENRPYFLLGLFRDMQRVDSDLMRQQALNSLQGLVRSDHRNIMAASSSAPTWSQSTQTHETANTGLIPSKDVTSEDDDDDDDEDLSETQLQEEIYAERSRLERVIRSSSLQSRSFDYTELVDHPSSLSTPTNGDEESLTFQRYLPAQEKPRHGRATRTSRESTDKRPSASEPRKHQQVDTKLRDQHVRSIMKATTAFLQEHIGDECSMQLLNYIICLVMSSIMTGGQEVVRLFQQQLTLVLEDTLLKYQGRRVRDCMKDVVVDISDVLNNEPTYFETTHNFADRVVTGQGESRDRPVQMANSEHKSEYTAFSRTSAGVHDNIDDGHKVTETSELENDDDGVSEQSFYDPGAPEQFYTVELAQSETKSFTRIGSDEDDDEGDELWSMNDPSETAVSRDARLENGIAHHTSLPPPPTRPEAEGAREDGTDAQTLAPRPTTSSRGEKVDGPSGETCAVSDVSQVNGSAVDLTSSNQEGQTPASSCEKLTLPAALPDSATRSDSLQLRGRYEEEQTSINGLDAVLASLGGMEELASDEASVLGPDLFSH